MFLQDEDFARIRVDEAIQGGLQSQYVQRGLGRNNRTISRNTLLLLGLLLLLAIAMAACLGTVVTTAPSGLEAAVTLFVF